MSGKKLPRDGEPVSRPARVDEVNGVAELYALTCPRLIGVSNNLGPCTGGTAGAPTAADCAFSGLLDPGATARLAVGVVLRRLLNKFRMMV